MGKTSAADLEIISGLFLSAAEQMRRTLESAIDIPKSSTS